MSGLREHRLRYMRAAFAEPVLPGDGGGSVTATVSYRFDTVCLRVARRNAEGYLMPNADLNPNEARTLAAELVKAADVVEAALAKKGLLVEEGDQ